MRRAINVVAAGSAANLALAGSGFLTAPLLARSLGTEDRGLYAALTSPTLLVGVIGTLGLQDLLTRYIASSLWSPTHGVKLLRQCLWPLIVVNVLLAVVLASNFAVQQSTSVIWPLALFLTTFPVAIVTSLVGGVATGAAWLSVVNINKIVLAGFRVVTLGALFVSEQLNLTTALIVFSIAQAVALAVMLVMLRTRLDNSEAGPAAERETTRGPARLIPESLGYLLGAALAVMLGRLDQSIAIGVVGANQLGIYAVAVSISELPSAVIYAMRQYFLGRSSNDFNRRFEFKAVSLAAGTGMLMAAVGCLVVPLLIPFLFGDSFRASIVPTQVLLCGLPFNAGLVIATALLIRGGRFVTQSIVYAIALVANLIAIFAIAPTAGAVGLAIATSGAYIIGLIAVAGIRMLMKDSRAGVD